MRLLKVIFVALPAVAFTQVIAQVPIDESLREQLCEQCPFDAPVRIRRDNFSSPNATTVVTADDLKALAVLTAADLVNQQPPTVDPESNADSATEGETPFNLGSSVAGLRQLQLELIEDAQDESASTDTSTEESGE